MERGEVAPLLLDIIYARTGFSLHLSFKADNGRLSHLLLLLLYRSGYIVSKYIRIEALIEKAIIIYLHLLLR